ncbi:MAG: permease-like cell division protein FtsX [Candidatus Moranbacteria bacterium]|nr:permease-like cell division protein FtsX [Candidatus Moranbacteria bacterium]MDD3964901.1 permease-like cell division protein FtsX [Candidatus Moranbacteria bacterium]
MKMLKLWRTFKEGKNNFFRNGWLTFATVSILTFSLFIVGLSLLLGITSQYILQNMREKVSINVSFNPDVSEERILAIREKLAQATKEIASVEYISRDAALEQFLEESGNDPTIVQALKEIGENPLFASLVIKAVQPDQYALIVSEMQKSTFQNDISRINYEKNKKIFERLDRMGTMTSKAGLALGAIFIFIAILITFNAIRITIYSHRQEFEVMRLVGASNIYVRMPFVFEGALYGFVASVLSIITLYGMAYYIAPFTDGSMNMGNMLDVFLGYFWYLFVGLIVLGITLGVVSSTLAIRRYLKA